MSRQSSSNATLPFYEEGMFSMYVVNQPIGLIRIFKWERGMTENNNLLGKFHLDGIPSAPRGVLQVEIDFTNPRHLFDAWPALKVTLSRFL